MIKKKPKNETRKPQDVAPADLIRVAGGESGKAKIKETVVAD